MQAQPPQPAPQPPQPAPQPLPQASQPLPQASQHPAQVPQAQVPAGQVPPIPGRVHPLPNPAIHKLTPLEKDLFETLESTDECSAYIKYVAECRASGNGKTTGNILIKRWLRQTATHPLDPAERLRRVQNAANERLDPTNLNSLPYYGPPELFYGPLAPQPNNAQASAGGQGPAPQPMAGAQPSAGGQGPVQQPPADSQGHFPQHSAGSQGHVQQPPATPQLISSGHSSVPQTLQSTQFSPSTHPQASDVHQTSGSQPQPHRPPPYQPNPVQQRPPTLDHNHDPHPAYSDNPPENTIHVAVSDSGVAVIPPPDFPNHPNHGIQWRYVKTIYKKIKEDGRMTTVRAYIGEDRNGVLRERQVVKNVEWRDDTAEQKRNELLEKYRILSRTKSEYILRPITKRTFRTVGIVDENGIPILSVNLEQMVYYYYGVRFYSEDCHAGDLKRLISQHNKAKGEIPSAFIWLVVRAISEALHNLQTGETFPTNDSDDPNPRVKSGWTSILHQDIEPANILLRPSPDGEYPVPVLADFDMSIRINQPTESTGAGTTGYRSPENVNATRRMNPDENSHTHLSSDVWGLGNVIWDMIHSTWGDDLINLIHELQQNAFEAFGNQGYMNQLSTMENTSSFHWLALETWAPFLPSPTGLKLEEMERKCGRYLPNDRPTAAQIAREANHYLTCAQHIFGIDASVIGPKLQGGQLETKPDSFVVGQVHRIHRTR